MYIVESTANGREYPGTLSQALAVYDQRRAECGQEKEQMVVLGQDIGEEVNLLAFHTSTFDWASSEILGLREKEVEA